MWFTDQVTDLVGERHARRYARAKWFELASSATLIILLPLGLAFALRPHHPALRDGVIALGSLAIVCATGAFVSAFVFLRGLGAEFGHSTWWCAKHVTLDQAHLVEFLNNEVVAGGGTTPRSVAENLDRELAVEDRVRARARVMRRRGLWLQVAALLLNLVTCIQGLRSYGVSTPQPSIQLPGFTANGQNELELALDCSSPPTITSSRLSITGDIFTCTSSDGGTVTYSYFATQDDAVEWLHEQVASRHLPAGDALLGDGWAVVTADQHVLARIRAAGGHAPIR